MNTVVLEKITCIRGSFKPSSISLSKLKRKLKPTKSEHSMNKTISSLKKDLLSTPSLNFTSSSPTFVRNSVYLDQKKILDIETQLILSKSTDLNSQFSIAIKSLNELITISPEFGNALSHITSIIIEHDSFIKLNAQQIEKTLETFKEDLKRLTKRYKKLAYEILGSQEKVRQKRSVISELKKEKTEMNEQLEHKNKFISELESRINRLECQLKNTSDELFCKNPVKFKNLLTVEISERKSFLHNEDGFISSIDPGSETYIFANPHDISDISPIINPMITIHEIN